MNTDGTYSLQVQSKVGAEGNWTRRIDEFDGNMFHAPQYAETRRCGGSRLLFFELCDPQGTCHGIALGIEVQSPAPIIGRFSRQLEFETYPVVRNDRHFLLQTMVRLIIARTKRRGCRWVTFNSYMTRTSLGQTRGWS